MNTNAMDTMHSDHRRWQAALSQWKDDLAEWDRELVQAGEALREVGAALDSHAAGLDAHARLLRREDQEVDDHEHLMACLARHQADHDPISQHGGHDAEACRFARLHDAHERLKKYHHTLMARISVLARAAAEPA
jgi:hypothetical protein